MKFETRPVDREAAILGAERALEHPGQPRTIMTTTAHRRAALEAIAQTYEERVLAILDNEQGQDRHDLGMQVDMTHAQISAALSRLRQKSLVHCGRWRETSVWWTTPRGETQAQVLREQRDAARPPAGPQTP